MRFWNNPSIVSKTPVLTVLLLEGANLSQLIRMWSERSAEGQSLGGWALVNLALLLWFNFYRVCVPRDQARWALWSTGFGVIMNASVILTVVWFRYFASVA